MSHQLARRYFKQFEAGAVTLTKHFPLSVTVFAESNLNIECQSLIVTSKREARSSVVNKSKVKATRNAIHCAKIHHNYSSLISTVHPFKYTESV
jgi:hypothetical protein